MHPWIFRGVGGPRPGTAAQVIEHVDLGQDRADQPPGASILSAR
jgi:hypothetical protein